MYLDSAIIVKLFVEEPDSASFVQALIGHPLSSSELARPEVLSALLGKERRKLITKAQRIAAWRAFNERVESQDLALYPITAAALKKANQILERCHPAVPLRTLDAIHTAACDLSQDFPLCTTDRRMRDAATALGIPVFPEAEALPAA